MSERNGSESFLEKIAFKLDIPGEALADVSRMEITGCRDMLIENHKGILEYGGDRIDVNLGGFILKLIGAELRLVAMNEREMRIRGAFTGIEFVF